MEKVSRKVLIINWYAYNYNILQYILLFLLIICSIIIPTYIIQNIVKEEMIRGRDTERSNDYYGRHQILKGISISSIKSNKPHRQQKQHHQHLIRKKVESFNNNLHQESSSKERRSRNKRIEEMTKMNHNNNSITIRKSIPRYRQLSLLQTPSLVGAKRGYIQNCDDNVNNDLIYWNNPRGIQDLNFITPFAVNNGHDINYVTFELDPAGWNNIRMSIEIIFIFAVATNRTIVLPPNTLTDDGDIIQFFDLHLLNKATTMLGDGTSIPKIITSYEFLTREEGKLFPFLPNEEREKFLSLTKHCNYYDTDGDDDGDDDDDDNDSTRTILGGSYGNCVVFDEDTYYGNTPMSKKQKKQAKKFCSKRDIQYYKSKNNIKPILHFQSSNDNYRLLDHFYFFFYFTNPKIHYHFHRYIRDVFHYNDVIFCAASKIISSLQNDGKNLGFLLNDDDDDGKSNNTGFYSSLHIRNGDDFQELTTFKQSMNQWARNTRDILLPNELLYISTDIVERTFFDPLSKHQNHHHNVRVLTDYKIIANLDQINPAYYGMIDSIVASKGRVFVGTYLSTFTNGINRLRSYYGYSMNHSFYGNEINDKKYSMRLWYDDDKVSNFAPFEKEWPDCCVRIDGDEFVQHIDF